MGLRKSLLEGQVGREAERASARQQVDHRLQPCKYFVAKLLKHLFTLFKSLLIDSQL